MVRLPYFAKTSTCPKCPNTSFELAEAAPKNSNVKMWFIQCDSCGAVVGATEYLDSTNILIMIAEKLGIKI